MNSDALCAVDDIPENGSKGFTLDNTPGVFALRKGGDIYVYKNVCPHVGFELNWMPDRFLDRSKEYILCSAHGAMFEITSGECIAGPCLGFSLSQVDHKIEHGLIYLQP